MGIPSFDLDPVVHRLGTTHRLSRVRESVAGRASTLKQIGHPTEDTTQATQVQRLQVPAGHAHVPRRAPAEPSKRPPVWPWFRVWDVSIMTAFSSICWLESHLMAVGPHPNRIRTHVRARSSRVARRPRRPASGRRSSPPLDALVITTWTVPAPSSRAARHRLSTPPDATCRSPDVHPYSGATTWPIRRMGRSRFVLHGACKSRRHRGRT